MKTRIVGVEYTDEAMQTAAQALAQAAMKSESHADELRHMAWTFQQAQQVCITRVLATPPGDVA
jgi:ABC-type phosphate transport system ATPase subunit